MFDNCSSAGHLNCRQIVKFIFIWCLFKVFCCFVNAFSPFSVNHQLREYTTVYNALLPSNNHETVHGIELEDCATRCTGAGFHCRSFEYHSASKKCYLSKASRETVAVSQPDNSGHDYYEMSK